MRFLHDLWKYLPLHKPPTKGVLEKEVHIAWHFRLCNFRVFPRMHLMDERVGEGNKDFPSISGCKERPLCIGPQSYTPACQRVYATSSSRCILSRKLLRCSKSAQMSHRDERSTTGVWSQTTWSTKSVCNNAKIMQYYKLPTEDSIHQH